MMRSDNLIIEALKASLADITALSSKVQFS
jgi:hypothetical protein